MLKSSFIALCLAASLFCSGAAAGASRNRQCFLPESLIALDKQNVAGGKGTLHGLFAFTRDRAADDEAIKEIGWMTLEKGSSIGLHAHKDNEDAYLIVEGEGVFTDGSGAQTAVGPGAVTIARPGQSHALANEKDAPLLFLDIIAKNMAADLKVVAADAKNCPQCFAAEDLIVLDKQKVAGGVGTLYGKFSFTRDQATKEQAIKEIGWMTLKKGDSIGLHKHINNEDTYIIISGEGVFTDGTGKETIVGPRSVTIARAGDSHALRNEKDEPLVFLDLIAQNHALKVAP